MDQQPRKKARRQPRKRTGGASDFTSKSQLAHPNENADNFPTQASHAANSSIGAANDSIDTKNAVPYSSFAGKLDLRLLKALEVLNFKYMTPVQQMVLSELPNYRSDCLVRAKTGTGKTVAFLLPALHSLLNSPSPRRGQVSILVVSPTRELALQIAKECDQLTSQIQPQLECHTAFGGTARSTNLAKFMNGSPSILVATPGRLLDYLSEPATAAKLSDIKTLILDEADTMLEQGFLIAIKNILKLLPSKQVAGWQGMCFSATMPEKIKDVLNVVLFPGYTSLSTIDPNEQPTIDKVPQFYVLMPSYPDMFVVLASLLELESKLSSKIIVFGITANMVSLFSKIFSKGLTSLPVFELHSRLSQNARTRTTADFKAASSGVLFASDVVGRGMDFPNVDLVIQVGLPSSGEQYVHRVGRTGRAENSGRAVLLLTHSESFFLRNNPKLPIQEHPQAAEILASGQQHAGRVEQVMHSLDEQTKQKAYSSFLGFFAGGGLMKPLRLDKDSLVKMSNDVAIRGMHCPEPPPMEKRTIGKMGLKGAVGINYALHSDGNSGPSHRPRGGNGGPMRVPGGQGSAGGRPSEHGGDHAPLNKAAGRGRGKPHNPYF